MVNHISHGGKIKNGNYSDLLLMEIKMLGLFKKKINSNFIKLDEEKLLKKNGKCRTLSNHIKLLIITDTHGFLSHERKDDIDKLIEAKDYDLCCCLGDITYSDYETILKYVPKEKIVALLGNHDEFDVLDYYELKDLNGEIITVKGIRIGGIQGSYRYKSKDFPSFTHEESIKFLNKMDEVDILLSHSGPFLGHKTNEVHNGLKGITEYLCKKHVPYNIHGHNHQNLDVYMKNGTKVMERYFIEVVEL